FTVPLATYSSTLSLHDALPIFVGWTPYHYVHNNPINLIDPTGMSAEGGEHDPPGSQNPRKAEVRPEGMSEREALSHITEVGGKKDRKSTRLNSSHVKISYAVFC